MLYSIKGLRPVRVDVCRSYDGKCFTSGKHVSGRLPEKIAMFVHFLRVYTTTLPATARHPRTRRPSQAAPARGMPPPRERRRRGPHLPPDTAADRSHVRSEQLLAPPHARREQNIISLLGCAGMTHHSPTKAGVA